MSNNAEKKEEIKMKKILLVALSGFAMVMATEAAQALTITTPGGTVEVGDIDSLLAETDLSNSSQNTETSWVNQILDPEVQFQLKIEGLAQADWFKIDGTSGVFALDLGGNEPGYFLVKTGNVTDDGNHDFLFANNDDLGWAVIDLAEMGFEKISNIKGVSHVTLFSGDPVPEPATMILFGAGLAGLAGIRRRKQA